MNSAATLPGGPGGRRYRREEIKKRRIAKTPVRTADDVSEMLSLSDIYAVKVECEFREDFDPSGGGRKRGLGIEKDDEIDTDTTTRVSRLKLNRSRGS